MKATHALGIVLLAVGTRASAGPTDPCNFGDVVDDYLDNDATPSGSGCGFDFVGDGGDMDALDIEMLWVTLKDEFENGCGDPDPLGPQDLRDTIEKLRDANDALNPNDCNMCSGVFASAYASIMYSEWGVLPTPEDLDDLDAGGTCEPPINTPPFPGDGSPQPLICAGEPCDVGGLLPGGDDMCAPGDICNFDDICLGTDCADVLDVDITDLQIVLTFPVEIPAVGDPPIPPSWTEEEDYGSPPMLLPPDEDENRPDPPGKKTWEPKPTDGKQADPDPLPPQAAWLIGAPSDDDDDTDEGEESSCDSDSSSGGDRRASGGGGNLSSLHPVELSQGAKLHTETDAVIRLTGRDFAIRRYYTSKNLFGAEDPGLVGHQWTMSVFGSVVEEPSGSYQGIYVVGAGLQRIYWFKPNGSGGYESAGPAQSLMTKVSSFDFGTHIVDQDVYELAEPGSGFWYFIDDSGSPLHGQPLLQVDIYGNSVRYEYQTYGTGGTASARLKKLVFNERDGSTGIDYPEAEALFQWYALEDDEIDEINGRLARIFVLRYDQSTGSTTETQRIEYVYKLGDDIDDNLPTDLGSPGDLIQVNKIRRVDDWEGAGVDRRPLYASVKRFTQYRYHDGAAASSTGDARLDVAGQSHQLKMVIKPEQIEFGAERLHRAGAYAPKADAVMEFAYRVLTRADDGIAFTVDDSGSASSNILVVDMAAKVVDYESSSPFRVAAQYIQSACGCGGGTSQGLKQAFTYYTWTDTGTDGLSTKIVETTWTGSAYTGSYRTLWTDMELRGPTDGKAPVIVHDAIVDNTGSGREWVTTYAYDADLRVTHEYTPAAHSAYTPTNGTAAPSVTLHSTGGLVRMWEYTDDHRRKEYSVAEGESEANTSIVWKRTFPTSPTSNQRSYYPIKMEYFRDGSGSTADDIETFWYEYGFHGGDAVAWVRIVEEAGLESEHGPTTSDDGVVSFTPPGAGAAIAAFDRYLLYDDFGRLRWVRKQDWSMVSYEYDTNTGRVTEFASNARSVNLDTSDYASVSKAGWGKDPATTLNWEGGTLVWTMGYDELGRLQQVEEPTGRTVRYRTEYRSLDLSEVNERPGVFYLTRIMYPHWLADGTFDGPASIAWSNIAGGGVAWSDLTLDGTSNPYSSDPAIESLAEDVLARGLTTHTYAGSITGSSRWATIDGSSTSVGREDSAFTYDALGRLETATDPEGTVTRISSYDVLNRVLEVQQETTSDATSKTIAKFYFDDPNTDTTPEQGEGNGRLSWVVRPVNNTSGDDRKKYIEYDFRDRPVIIQQPQAPHIAIEYDDLDRVHRVGLFAAVPDDVDDLTATRGMLQVLRYDQRGLRYAADTAIDASQSSPTYLRDAAWFDGAGHVRSSFSPNGPGIKLRFDGHGRVVTSYLTDRRNDAVPGASGNYADAVDVDDDRVMEQAEYDFAATTNNGRIKGTMIMATTRVRPADATAYGALTGSTGITSYVGYVYDEAARVIRTVDFGTNKSAFSTGTTAPTWPDATPPAPGSGPEIVELIEYNERGLVGTHTDPKDRETRFAYDALNRLVYTIENAVDTVTVTWNGTLGRYEVTAGVSGATDQNRITSRVFDRVGHVTKLVAHQAESTGSDAAEITTYTYGTTTSTDDVASNNLLKSITYPDSGVVTLKYNRQGEVKERADQNGTTHAYTRDDLGRVVEDEVTAFGTDIDDAVESIAYTFDTFGRLQFVQSIGASSTVLNGVEFEYTPLWQVEAYHQNHDGSTRSGGSLAAGTESIEYAYVTSAYTSSNYSVEQFSKYPHEYGSGTNTTARTWLSAQSASLIRPCATNVIGIGGALQNLVEYEYLGYSTVTKADMPVPDFRLDRQVDDDGSVTTGAYAAFDRFGRLTNHNWVDGGFTEHGTLTTVPDRPQILALEYAYDLTSNILHRYDVRPGARRPFGGGPTVPTEDFEYAYDGLDRLDEALRGSLDTGGLTVADGASQNWDLSYAGNWDQFGVDVDGSGTFSGGAELESRTHNTTNEFLSSSKTGLSRSITYDAAGNLTQNNTTISSVLRSREYTYDAWNRIVLIADPTLESGVISTYEYNGLHHRIEKVSDPTGGGDEHRLYYYNPSWQLVEEHVDLEDDDDLDRISQYFWGSRYIDELVAKRIDRDPEGETGWDTSTGIFFFVTDHQFSVVAVLRADGSLYERLTYDAYGNATHRWAIDFNWDGAATSADQTALTIGDIGVSGYVADMDLDRDGDVDTADHTIVGNMLSAWGGSAAALPAGWICNPADDLGPDSQFGYCGYQFDPEVNHYAVRFRTYDPEIGRWLQRDPIGYAAGVNLYGYVNGMPTGSIDPLGLWGLIELIFPYWWDDESVANILAVSSWYQRSKSLSLLERAIVQYKLSLWQVVGVNRGGMWTNYGVINQFCNDGRALSQSAARAAGFSRALGIASVVTGVIGGIGEILRGISDFHEGDNWGGSGKLTGGSALIVGSIAAASIASSNPILAVAFAATAVGYSIGTLFDDELGHLLAMSSQANRQAAYAGSDDARCANLAQNYRSAQYSKCQKANMRRSWKIIGCKGNIATAGI